MQTPDWKALEAEQKRLAAAVQTQGYRVQQADLIACLDIQYEEEKAFVAIDLQRYGAASWQTYVGQSSPGLPYRPRYFCFREGPPLLDLLQLLPERPDCLVVDGHGLAHPRQFGVACWLGVKANLPCIGVAKRALLPYEGELGPERGASLDILQEGNVVGRALRTRTGVKPLFVSVGHRIDLDAACELLWPLAKPYRQIEGIRRADRAARALAKGESGDWQVLR